MIATNEEMRRMDQRMAEEAHVSVRQLMMQAATALLERLRALYSASCRYGIFCGSGNNGGDGFALALLLKDLQLPFVICAADGKRSPAAAYYAEQLQREGTNIYDLTAAEEVIGACDVIIDALFGTGLNRELSGIYAQVVSQINRSKKTIVAVDIPSGMDGNAALNSEVCVCADRTITFECLKKGMLSFEQRKKCGKIDVVSIGILPQYRQCSDPTLVLTKDHVRTMLPRRYVHSHKGTYGKVLIVGGSRHMSGAVVLCARALLRSGAGMVTCMIPQCIHEIVASQLQEAMFKPISDDGTQMVIAGFAEISELETYDLIVAGNGMGRGPNTLRIVERILQSSVPCILDGDALYEAGKKHLFPAQRSSAVIVTPHLKELEYLTSIPLQQLQAAPWTGARRLLSQYPYLCVVAKDDLTWIFYQDKQALNIIGNNGLAKGGSGDVLCGMTAGLFAQSKDPFSAACAAVYAHASCADLLIKRMDPMGMLPSDLIEQLPGVYAMLRKNKWEQQSL